MAPGLVDDAVDRGQPKPGPTIVGLGREERLEHVLERGRVHAGPGVRHREQDVGPRDHVRVARGVRVVELHVGGLDRQLAAVGHRVAGVDREVDDDLLDLAGVGLQVAELRVQG